MLKCCQSSAKPNTIRLSSLKRPSLLFILFLLISSQVFAQPAVPADCQASYKRALEIMQEYETKLSPADHSLAESVIDKALKKGATRADGYTEYGGGEMMKGQFSAAAWGSLKAATLEWNPRHVGNIGIYL